MENKKTIGYLSAVSIGIDGMVGGGIFAVLGLAVNLSHVGTSVAFIIVGLEKLDDKSTNNLSWFHVIVVKMMRFKNSRKYLIISLYMIEDIEW